jgi:hypothetical protein
MRGAKRPAHLRQIFIIKTFYEIAVRCVLNALKVSLYLYYL